jgi:hypothetical protein
MKDLMKTTRLQIIGRRYLSVEPPVYEDRVVFDDDAGLGIAYSCVEPEIYEDKISSLNQRLLSVNMPMVWSTYTHRVSGALDTKPVLRLVLPNQELGEFDELFVGCKDGDSGPTTIHTMWFINGQNREMNLFRPRAAACLSYECINPVLSTCKTLVQDMVQSIDSSVEFDDQDASTIQLEDIRSISASIMRGEAMELRLADHLKRLKEGIQRFQMHTREQRALRAWRLVLFYVVLVAVLTYVACMGILLALKKTALLRVVTILASLILSIGGLSYVLWGGS